MLLRSLLSFWSIQPRTESDGLLLSSQPFLGLRDVASDLLAGWPNVIQDASQREAPVAGRFGIDLGQPDAARGVLVVVVAASAEVTFLAATIAAARDGACLSAS